MRIRIATIMLLFLAGIYCRGGQEPVVTLQINILPGPGAQIGVAFYSVAEDLSVWSKNAAFPVRQVSAKHYDRIQEVMVTLPDGPAEVGATDQVTVKIVSFITQEPYSQTRDIVYSRLALPAGLEEIIELLGSLRPEVNRSLRFVSNKTPEHISEGRGRPPENAQR